MNYLEQRNKRLEMFEDTLRRCESSQKRMKEIAYSRANTVLWKTPLQDIVLGEQRFQNRCEVLVVTNKLISEVKWLCKECSGERIGVLDMASPIHSGGSVLKGGEGMEESLCRETTLYPCLDTDYLRREFYDKNVLGRDGAHSDVCVYIPAIVGVSTEDTEGNWREEQEEYSFDVICSAIPSVREQRRMEEQMEAVLKVAASKEIDVLVLGIPKRESGKDTEWMLEICKKALRKYSYFFRAVRFVI